MISNHLLTCTECNVQACKANKTGSLSHAAAVRILSTHPGCTQMIKPNPEVAT